MGLDTYGILYPAYLSVIKQGSLPSGFNVIPRGFSFGIVNSVNYANIKTNVGATVFYKDEDAILVTAGGTDYYLIEEESLILKATIDVSEL